jgi:transcriptional regulator with XRE-family HTH domain
MEKSLELDRKGLSQKELASKMGVTPQYINESALKTPFFQITEKRSFAGKM